MARRKKRGSHRRRRVSGFGGGFLVKAAGIVAGAVAANVLASKIPIGDAKIKAAALVGIGALVVPKFIKGSMGEALGSGIIATAGVSLVSSLGLLNGIGQIDDGGVMAGVEAGDNLSVIAGDDGSVMAGSDDLAVLAGMEDEENYF